MSQTTVKNSNSLKTRGACNVCGSNRFEQIYKASYTDAAIVKFLSEYYDGRVKLEVLSNGQFALEKCHECGFIWQQQCLDNSLMVELYENWISADASLEKEEKRKSKNFREKCLETGLIRHFFPKVDSGEKLRVLDFGMGWGTWCLAAIEQGYDVYGLELSTRRAAYGRSKGVNVVDQIENHTSKFDYVSAEQVFEHVSDPKGLLGELTKCLEAKGIVRISVPNGQNFERKFRKKCWAIGKDEVHPLEHINCFNSRSLAQLGVSVGLAKLATRRLILAHFLQILDGDIDLKWAAKSILKHVFRTAVFFEKKST